MRKLIILVLALSIVLSYLFWRFGPNINIGNFNSNGEDPNQPVTITVWGLWEEENLIRPAIEEYKKVRPNVTVEYEYKTSLNYRTRTQTQIAENQGPDIFMIHNSWLPMFLKSNSVLPAPANVFTVNDLRTNFYPIVADSFTSNNQVYGVSRGVDGLALYYNVDLLKNAGIATVPTTWPELAEAAKRVTVIDAAGKIQTSGLAIGAVGNVDHWSDILGLLFLQQPNTSFENPGDERGQTIVNFYTQFVIDPRNKTWDTSMEPSTQAFAAGRLAFYFAPSWRAFEIRNANPELQFRIAPVPQLPGGNIANWGNFWGYAVSSKSLQQKESWEFLKFLTSAQSEKLLYQEASKVRLMGLPYSRLDLKQEIEADPLAGAFVTQAPTYKSWYLNSDTRDQGINDEITKYYEDAINTVLAGGNAGQALQTTSQGIQQVLQKYTGPTQGAPTAQ